MKKIDADILLEEIKKDCEKNPELYFILGFISKYVEEAPEIDELLKEQEKDVELCDRCGRRRLKSNRERMLQ